jgi:1,4-alpha-glucan branching enzyme
MTHPIASEVSEPILQDRLARLLAHDPGLTPYRTTLLRRLRRALLLERQLRGPLPRLADMAAGHTYFGLHRQEGRWVFREWAPNAIAIHLIGDFCGWQPQDRFGLAPLGGDGVWEIALPDGTLRHGDLYRLHIRWYGGAGDRLPTHARRVVQDPETLIFNAQVWEPPTPYHWRAPTPARPQNPLIYEAHVGMAQEAERIGRYAEFTAAVLPRIAGAGYNTVQLMALQEHPYYASFGYHVGSFFAVSSRFGTPEDLKRLIDQAHAMGLRVIMDLVHSHAVCNHVEGLSHFDGSEHQFFHAGPRGLHTAWNSRLFDYGKGPVLHFLLSNCRFWLDEFHVDGFRFDGVTSMLYLHHGLNRSFVSYDDYFDASVDEDALAYLALANQVIHEVRPDALTIAEDVSGMPGLALPLEGGGSGFDCRFAMGIADFWIRLVKEMRDEDWPMGTLWHELNNRRRHEGSISYAESHDQALVGDQTLIFRLLGAEMYSHMERGRQSLTVDRGMALHKLIRLITLATAGTGYLNFMGNEFGHPDWIDFPREGNGWSFRYARRLWYLADDSRLRYPCLKHFDVDMLRLVRTDDLLRGDPSLLWCHEADKVLALRRGPLVLAFNFHPERSFADYRLPAPPGEYRLALCSDATRYGGHDRVAPGQSYFTLPEKGMAKLSLYLPSRCALVLRATPPETN